MQTKPLRKAHLGMTTFTHIDQASTVRHFDIDFLGALVERLVAAGRLEIVPVAVTEEGLSVIQQERGVDQHRLQRVAEFIDEHGLDSMAPVFFAADVSPGTHLLVDGTHRYLLAGLMGLDTVPAVLLPKEVWETCLVDASEFMGESLTADQLMAMPSFMP